MTRILALAACASLGVAAGCVDRLPDQDRRILQAGPVAKMSTGDLWNEYQSDRRAADRKYWGKPVEISGRVSSAVTEAPPRLMFLPEPGAAAGVEARLLDDRAQSILAEAAAGTRVTLRCFCEGLQKNVILKSCIKP